MHSIDPQQHLDEILRILPYWPRDRYLELAPYNWTATRAKLDPDELSAPLCSFTIPRDTGRSAVKTSLTPRLRLITRTQDDKVRRWAAITPHRSTRHAIVTSMEEKSTLA